MDFRYICLDIEYRHILRYRQNMQRNFQDKILDYVHVHAWTDDAFNKKFKCYFNGFFS